jgi:hypothetical protein
MPMPQVAQAAQDFFACTSWTSVHHFPKRWIALRLPLIINAFGHLGRLSATISATSSAFSSWLGICTGRAACTGVWPGWAQAWPWAKISPPKHHLCLHLRLLGLYGFFLHALIILNLHSASRNGGSLSDCLALRCQHSAAFHLCFLHGDFRIVPSFMFSCPPLTTLPHSNFWDPARCHIGWVRKWYILLHCRYIFSFSLSFFFFANFLFCSQVTALYPLC